MITQECRDNLDSSLTPRLLNLTLESVSVFYRQAYRGIPQGSRFVGRVLAEIRNSKVQATQGLGSDRELRNTLHHVWWMVLPGIGYILEGVLAWPCILWGDRVIGILGKYELRNPTLTVPSRFLLYRLILLVSEYITTCLRYGICVALVIAIQPILTQRTSNRTTHWSVGSPPDATTVQQDRSRFTSHEGEFTNAQELTNF
jgi:hypothetical protein